MLPIKTKTGWKRVEVVGGEEEEVEEEGEEEGDKGKNYLNQRSTDDRKSLAYYSGVQ